MAIIGQNSAAALLVTGNSLRLLRHARNAPAARLPRAVPAVEPAGD